MAGSRLPNFGTIFTRTTGLLKSGALKEVPVWYDVYKKYPPELEPIWERPIPPQDPIPEIVYEEDFERAAKSANKYKTRKSGKKGVDRRNKELTSPVIARVITITEDKVDNNNNTRA